MRRRRKLGEPALTGPARADRRTKNLIPRLQPGEIAIIDHEDLDQIAAEGLLAAGAVAVVNAASSMTGRYPSFGALAVTKAGLPLLDEVGSEVLDHTPDGTVVSIIEDELWVDGIRLARGVRQVHDVLEERLEAAKHSISGELEKFALNTLEYLQREPAILADSPEVPETATSFVGRQALVVVRGLDYEDDLEALRRIGYIHELKPVLIGVDGGADALLDVGYKPEIIVGDFDSVSKDALRCGAELIVHAYVDGHAPGADRLDRLGFDYQIWAASGTSEDVAMNLAYEAGAELIVAVGSHNSMAEFYDKGREGMASTFLTRMKVGRILVDAKGVNRLYKSQVRKRDLVILILAALFTIVVIAVVTEPIRLLLRTIWLDLQ